MNIRALSFALLAAAAPGFAVVAVPTSGPYSVLLHDASFGGDLTYNDVDSVHGILVLKALGGSPKVQPRAEKVPARSEFSITLPFDGDSSLSDAVGTPVADPASCAEIWLNTDSSGANAGGVAKAGGVALKLNNLGFQEWTLSADQDGVEEGVTFTYSSKQVVAF